MMKVRSGARRLMRPLGIFYFFLNWGDGTETGILFLFISSMEEEHRGEEQGDGGGFGDGGGGGVGELVSGKW